MIIVIIIIIIIIITIIKVIVWNARVLIRRVGECYNIT